jgi:hypothetical protein
MLEERYKKLVGTARDGAIRNRYRVWGGHLDGRSLRDIFRVIELLEENSESEHLQIASIPDGDEGPRCTGGNARHVGRMYIFLHAVVMQINPGHVSLRNISRQLYRPDKDKGKFYAN